MILKRQLMIGMMAAIISFAGCSTKITDADIKTNIETKLKARPDMSGAIVDVTNGIVTITGECGNEASRTNCEEIAQATEGVKTVINNLMFPGMPSDTVKNITAVAGPAIADSSVAAAAGTATAVDPLSEAVGTAVKKFPTVEAEVKDGVITLTGDIRKNDLSVLMRSLNALKPKKIEQKLTIIKTGSGRVKHAYVKTAKVKRVSAKQAKTKKRSRRH